MKMKRKTVWVLTAIFLAYWPQTVSAQAEQTANGIKAALKVTPSQSMVDLLLSDARTGKAVTDAKVVTRIKGPDGKVQEKELLGMKMGEVFSYMNTLDMSKDGGYSFDIAVTVGNKMLKFNFVYEVK